LVVALVLAIAAGAVLGWTDIAQANQIRSLQQMQQSFQRIIHGNQASLAVLTQPGLRIVEFSGSQGAGNLMISQDGKTAALFLQKIPVLDSDHTYQVWLVPTSGSSVSTGTLYVRYGQPYVPHVINSTQPLKDFTLIQITVEPKGGSAQPTTAPILTAKLQ
jgi:anti-sigma-K factor RskA